MQLKKLFDDDGAVSPVIGVILMVAITVILAAVIATFVLGLGEQVSDTAPNASFSFDAVEDNGDYDVTVTHTGGPNIDQSQLNVSYEDTTEGQQKIWETDPASAGTSTEVTASADSTVRVIWTSQDGQTSATLATFDVPE